MSGKFWNISSDVSCYGTTCFQTFKNLYSIFVLNFKAIRKIEYICIGINDIKISSNYTLNVSAILPTKLFLPMWKSFFLLLL